MDEGKEKTTTKITIIAAIKKSHTTLFINLLYGFSCSLLPFDCYSFHFGTHLQLIHARIRHTIAFSVKPKHKHTVMNALVRTT